MNENVELLEYIYQNSDMGVKSTTYLINLLNKTDNKIKKIVEGQLKGYENFVKESKNLIKKYNKEVKDNGPIADMGTYLGIKMDFMKDNSDSKIADLLTKGFTMGVVDIDKKINKFEDDARKDILDLAKKLKKFQQKNIDLLKSYL